MLLQTIAYAAKQMHGLLYCAPAVACKTDFQYFEFRVLLKKTQTFTAGQFP